MRADSLTLVGARDDLPEWEHLQSGTEREALMLVAHPDDEVIFGGGLLLATPRWRWHLIVCVDPSPDRTAEGMAAVASLRSHGVNIVTHTVVGLRDEVAHDETEWYRQIVNATAGITPDLVVTHGVRGDYGHLHHVTVNLCARRRYLLPGSAEVWNFWHPCPEVPQVVLDRLIAVSTQPDKRAVMHEAYPEAWEALALDQRVGSQLLREQFSGQLEFYTA